MHALNRSQKSRFLDCVATLQCHVLWFPVSLSVSFPTSSFDVVFNNLIYFYDRRRLCTVRRLYYTT